MRHSEVTTAFLDYTPAIFRLDPIWNPLRDRPNFKRLIAQR